MGLNTEKAKFEGEDTRELDEDEEDEEDQFEEVEDEEDSSSEDRPWL